MTDLLLLVSQRLWFLGLIKDNHARRGCNQCRNDGGDCGDDTVELLHFCTSLLKLCFIFPRTREPRDVSVSVCQEIPISKLMPYDL